MAGNAPHGEHVQSLGADQTDDLQYAFFNGVGYESWENIWGIWNQLTPRDAEALRRIATIERDIKICCKRRLGAARSHGTVRHFRE